MRYQLIAKILLPHTMLMNGVTCEKSAILHYVATGEYYFHYQSDKYSNMLEKYIAQ